MNLKDQNNTQIAPKRIKKFSKAQQYIKCFFGKHKTIEMHYYELTGMVWLQCDFCHKTLWKHEPDRKPKPTDCNCYYGIKNSSIRWVCPEHGEIDNGYFIGQCGEKIYYDGRKPE
jgi:hypothetical protein